MKKLTLLILCLMVLLLTSCYFDISFSDIETDDEITEETEEKKDSQEDKKEENPTEEETPSEPEEEEENKEEVKVYYDVFLDPLFADGFNVYEPNEATVKMHSSKLATANATTSAKWEIAQWASKYDIFNSKKSSGFGEYSFINNETTPVAKKLIVNTITGSIKMTVNASVEYDNDRKDGESWPHLLLSQSYYGADLVHVSEMDEINMNVSYKVTNCENKTTNYNSSMHCSQFVWYVTLQNRDESSSDYGSYIWFGLNLFDNRMQGSISSGFASQDGGKANNTGAFIYQPTSDKYIESKNMPAVGEKITFSFNLLDEAKAAFELAKSRGYLGSTTWDQIYIGSTNFGFEVTGTFDTSISLDYISIKYHKKDNK